MSTLTEITCPVCGQATAKNKTGNWKEYELLLCSQCDVIFSRPFVAGSQQWYEQSGIYQLAKYHDKLWWHHEQFFAAPPGGRTLLDIGCNNGIFLHHAKQRGYDVTGIDFNEQSIEAGKAAFGLKQLYCCTIEEFRIRFPGVKFDVITVFEVLEHLDKPGEFFEQVKSLLNPDGYIAISLPNRDMFINPLGDSDNPPHHLTKWSFRAIENFLHAHGCEILMHTLKHTTADDYARSFDYNILRKIDQRIRTRIKGSIAKQLQDAQPGDAKMPLLYRMRQIQFAVLRLLFQPIAAFFRLFRVQGLGQYLLVKLR